ncbi:MAG: hypothetical protein VKJ31_03660 [Synechococcus sp.]|nr:hypothetical protein [Synechococcus sp.]
MPALNQVQRLQLQQCFAQQHWAELLEFLEPLDLAAQRDPELWFLLARAHRGLGQPELGFSAFAEAQLLDPTSAELQLEAVEALLDQAQWGTAWQLLQAPVLQPLVQQPRLQLLQARCLAQLGQAPEAEEALLALQQHPDVDPYRLGLALVEVNLQLGELERAQFCLERAAALAPPDEEQAILQLELLAATWQPQHLQQLEQLGAQWPASRRLQLRLAKLLERKLLLEQARQVLEQAVARFGCAGALAHQWLQFLAATGDLEALRQWGAAARLSVPPLALPLLEAQCLINLNRDGEARDCLEDQPQPGQVLELLAQLASRAGEHQQSAALLEQRYRECPTAPDLAYHLAIELLRLGRWTEAWPLYEQRFQCSFARSFLAPGFAPKASDLSPAGRHVVVFSEQGFGDAVMLASMLPDLQQQAASVRVIAEPRLVPLLQASFPHIEVVSAIDAACFEAADSCYGIGSLGRFYRPSPEHCPGTPYLQVPNADLQHWRQQLEALGSGLKIGVAWRGGGAMQQHQRRSLELPQLLPVLQQPGVHWVNLQYRHSAAELAQLQESHGIGIHHFAGITEDLLATAALTQALDLVITVQQTALHIAGASGTPAWVLLPMAPEWRYGIEGSRMPWYGSVELFRQSKLGDWAGPIEQIRQRLQLLVQRVDGHNGAHS